MKQLRTSIVVPFLPLLVVALGACSGAYSDGPLGPAPETAGGDRAGSSSANGATNGTTGGTDTTPATGNETAAPAGQTFRGVYITSRKSLYRFDVTAKTVQKVANYDCVGAADPDYARGAGMSDIAIDHNGVIYGVATRGTTEGLLIRINAANGSCEQIQELGDFGLRGFASILGANKYNANEDTLVTSVNSMYLSVRMGEGAFGFLGQVELRPMGFIEDLVSIPDRGVFAVDHSISTGAQPRLLQIDRTTGATESVVGLIASSRVTGLAYWSGVLYGVTYDRRVISIDPATAVKTDVVVSIESGDDDFSGAAETPAVRPEK
jgi:hypothetical protein